MVSPGLNDAPIDLSVCKMMPQFICLAHRNRSRLIESDQENERER